MSILSSDKKSKRKFTQCKWTLIFAVNLQRHLCASFVQSFDIEIILSVTRYTFQVFDILPLYGTLKPGDTEQVTFTFFGHQDTTSVAKAICEVEGGPTYEVMLKGEASLVQYRFDCLHIDYGKQVRVKSPSGLLPL